MILRRLIFTFLVLTLFTFKYDSYADASQVTVILATFSWDVECNCLKGGPTADFRLDYFDPERKKLTPLNNTRLNLVQTDQSYDEIDPAFVKVQNLNKASLIKNPHTDRLKPGSVIVFQTSEGRYGKMQIIGFRSSHDFSFPEAKKLPQKLRDYLQDKPVIQDYHMEVRWELLH